MGGGHDRPGRRPSHGNNNGGWDSSGWGSETSTDGWSSWGSSSTSDWGDWGSSSTDGWGDWGDYEETTIDWFNNDTFWEDTTMPNWNYEDYNTTDIAAGDLEYQPSFEELNNMGVDEIIYAFQMMDADYMKKLLKENSKGIKAMMSKFSREEQYRIMQSMKSKTPVKQSVTISELRRMNASSIMRTFKTLNITFMKQFMKEYEQEIKRIISQFSKAEQKDIRMIIDKRIKQKRP